MVVEEAKRSIGRADRVLGIHVYTHTRTRTHHIQRRARARLLRHRRRDRRFHSQWQWRRRGNERSPPRTASRWSAGSGRSTIPRRRPAPSSSSSSRPAVTRTASPSGYVEHFTPT